MRAPKKILRNLVTLVTRDNGVLKKIVKVYIRESGSIKQK